MQGIMEAIFESAYLLGSLAIAIYMIIFNAKHRKSVAYFVFAIMIFILAFGDAFHLVPRMIALNSGEGGMEKYKAELGIGTLITSITMTIYYVIFYFFIQMDRGKKYPLYLTIIVCALALARIILCVFPQNNWTGEGTIADTFYPLAYAFGIYRNIPFFILGGLIIFLLLKEYFLSSKQLTQKRFTTTFIWIILSFAFYAVVVFGVDFVPLLGTMMLPKTVCYVVVSIQGLLAMRRHASLENPTSETN
jgi:hypothetical protein